MKDFELREIGVPFNPNEHVLLPHSMYLSAIRNALNIKDLHLYFHKEAKTYVLFTWWRKPVNANTGGGGIMCEIELMDQNPDSMNSNPPSANDIRLRLRPTIEIYKEMKKFNDNQLSEIRLQKEADKSERDHFVKGLKKEGHHETAYKLDIGAIPFMPPDEETGELFREMKEATKSKLIVPLSY